MPPRTRSKGCPSCHQLSTEKKEKKNPLFSSPGMKQELHEKTNWDLEKRCFYNETCRAQGRAQLDGEFVNLIIFERLPDSILLQSCHLQGLPRKILSSQRFQHLQLLQKLSKN